MELKELKEAIKIVSFEEYKKTVWGETKLAQALQTLLSFCELACKLDEVMDIKGILKEQLKSIEELCSVKIPKIFWEEGIDQAHDEILAWLLINLCEKCRSKLTKEV